MPSHGAMNSDHLADIAKVQERLGHIHIATTGIYDHRLELSPTFRVDYW